jgi:hypothetical protein
MAVEVEGAALTRKVGPLFRCCGTREEMKGRRGTSTMS